MFSAGGRGRVMFVVGAALLTAAPAISQAPRSGARPGPRLEPVAETQLLMEGLNQANFRGLERHLKQRPTEAEAWTFVRGQALLIAETGNLLMLRPPRNPGETVWMDRATELRDSASALARLAAARDYEGSRAALGSLANSCNRCHQTFRVPTRVVPFADGPERKVGLSEPAVTARRDQLDKREAPR